MLIPVNKDAEIVKRQHPCKDGCMYAKDLGAIEHSCGGVNCFHYEDDNEQNDNDLPVN